MHDITTDTLNKRHDNPLVAHSIHRRHLQLFILALGMGVMICMIPLKQPVTACLASFAVGLAFLYSSPTTNFKAKGIAGIVCLGIFYSVLPVLVGYLQIQQMSYTVSYTCLILLFVSISGLLAKDYKDLHGDNLSGKKTVLILYGKSKTQILALLSWLLGLTLQIYVVFLQGLSVWPIIFLGLYGTIIGFYHYKNGKLNSLYIRASHACLLGVAYVNLA